MFGGSKKEEEKAGEGDKKEAESEDDISKLLEVPIDQRYLGDDENLLKERYGEQATEWAKTSPVYDYDIKKAYLYEEIAKLSPEEREVVTAMHTWFIRLSNIKFTNNQKNRNIFFKIHWGYRYKVYRIPREVPGEDDKVKIVFDIKVCFYYLFGFSHQTILYEK